MRGKLLMFALVAACTAPAMSLAETLTWKMRSYHRNAVEVQFYSESRNHVWPGVGRVYALRDYDIHTYRISCIQGEKICYGAWVAGDATSYWGVGKDNRSGCRDCCYTCDGGITPIRNLNERH